jgi:hypothetical protein
MSLLLITFGNNLWYGLSWGSEKWRLLACSAKAGTSVGIYSQSVFKRRLASRTSCMRLSPHTVRRILFCCMAKARFLGIGRDGSPTHACSVTTGSEVEWGGRVFHSDLNRVLHRKRNYSVHLLVCGRMWFRSKIIWNMNPWSCLHNGWSKKLALDTKQAHHSGLSNNDIVGSNSTRDIDVGRRLSALFCPV